MGVAEHDLREAMQESNNVLLARQTTRPKQRDYQGGCDYRGPAITWELKRFNWLELCGGKRKKRKGKKR